MAGFGLAGYWFGTFSHVWNQATATGFETAPYGVSFLSAGASEAMLIYNSIWNNTSGYGICQNGTNIGVNGSAATPNVLNETSAANGINMTGANNNSANSSTTIVCLNWVDAGGISYLWQNYSGYDPLNNFNNTTNATDLNGTWNNGSAPANATFVTPYFLLNQSTLTGGATNSSAQINITGCNPVVNVNNTTAAAEALANCPYFIGNNQTNFLPHAGFFLSNGTWVSTYNTTYSYWNFNRTGYLATDTVFYVSLEFGGPTGALPNMTYEVVLSLAGATPIPQVFFVNTGAGGTNETLIFVFDMTMAWGSALPGSAYGANNTTGLSPFGSDLYAGINTFSATVSQCYIDMSGMMACPDSLGGTGFP